MQIDDERKNELETLIRMNPERAVEKLINLSVEYYDATSSLNNLQMCMYVAEALGRAGGARAAEALIDMLEDENLLVRKNATEALEKIGDPRAVEVLKDAFSDMRDTKDILRRERLHDQEKAMLMGKNVAEALEKMENQRLLAGRYLGGALRNAYSIREISDLLGLPEPYLHELQPSDVLKMALVDKDDKFVRGYAALGLGKLIGGITVEMFEMRYEEAGALIGALDNKDEFVRKCAGLALEKIGGARAVGVLEEAFGDIYKRFKTCDERAIEVLVGALNNDDVFVRVYSMLALGKLCGERAEEALIEVLRDRKDMYGYAELALGEIMGWMEKDPSDK